MWRSISLQLKDNSECGSMTSLFLLNIHELKSIWLIRCRSEKGPHHESIKTNTLWTFEYPKILTTVKIYIFPFLFSTCKISWIICLASHLRTANFVSQRGQPRKLAATAIVAARKRERERASAHESERKLGFVLLPVTLTSFVYFFSCHLPSLPLAATIPSGFCVALGTLWAKTNTTSFPSNHPDTHPH
jgi:hypothetical protein